MNWTSLKYQIFLGFNVLAFFFLAWNGSIPQFVSPLIAKVNFLTIAIAGTFVFGFLQDNYQPLRPFKNWLSLTLFAFYLFYVFSVFTSNNQAQALKALEYKMGIVFLAYVFFSNSLFYRKNKAFFLKTISLGLITLLLVLDIKALSIYFESSFFPTYTQYTHELHPTYVGLAAFIVLVLCLKKLEDSAFALTSKNYLLIAIALFMIIHLLLIQSRSTFICAALAFVLYSYYFFFKKKKYVFALLLVAFGAGVYFMKNLSLSNRVNEAYQTAVSSRQSADESGTNFRWNIIKSYPEILSSIWISGVGKGDAQDFLNSFYHEKGWKTAENSTYNAHNQFVQTWIEFGIVGLLLFALIFFWPMFLYRGFYFKMILLGFGVSMFFESLLERQAGILLFVYIYCLFNCGIEHSKKIKL